MTTTKTEAERLADRINPETDWYEFDQVTWCNAAAAELRRLSAEVERLQSRVHTCGPTCSKAGCINRRLTAEVEALKDSNAARADRIDRLGEMVEALRADAGRWQWIADGNNFDESFALLTDPKLTTYELTKAVDAAISTSITKEQTK